MLLESFVSVLEGPLELDSFFSLEDSVFELEFLILSLVSSLLVLGLVLLVSLLSSDLSYFLLSVGSDEELVSSTLSLIGSTTVFFFIMSSSLSRDSSKLDYPFSVNNSCYYLPLLTPRLSGLNNFIINSSWSFL